MAKNQFYRAPVQSAPEPEIPERLYFEKFIGEYGVVLVLADNGDVRIGAPHFGSTSTVSDLADALVKSNGGIGSRANYETLIRRHIGAA